MVFSDARLSPEAERLVQEVRQGLSDLKGRAGQLSDRNSFLQDLRNFLERFETSLNNSLSVQLREIEEILLPDQMLMSLYLERVRDPLQQLLTQLRAFLTVQAQIPSILYYLNGWFFALVCSKRTKGQSKEVSEEGHSNLPPYIIALGNSYQTGEFTQYLLAHKLDILAPRVYEALKDCKFYFIEIPYFDATETKTDSWIICLHESSHVVDDFWGLVSEKFDGLPKGYYSLIRAATAGDRNAHKALRASEYLADGFALDVGGPLFAIKFIRNYSGIYRILHSVPSLTHPPDYARICYFIERLKSAGFGAAVTQLQSGLENVVPERENRDLSQEDIELQAISNEVLRAELEETSRYLHEKFCEELGSLGGAGSAEIAKDFLECKPVVALPPLLFTLVGLELPELTPKQNEFFADMMRIGIIEEAFKKEVLPYLPKQKSDGLTES